MTLPESADSVTAWIRDLRCGDGDAAARLWKYIEPRLIALGRRQVKQIESSLYDEDDLAQSAFHALCQAVQEDRYHELSDRNEMWKLLTTITLNKFRNRAGYESAQRRGGGVRPTPLNADSDTASVQLRPDQRLQIQEECERLLKLLGSDSMRRVALLKVEGYTNAEVRRTLNCTESTVQRRIEFIRRMWTREINGANTARGASSRELAKYVRGWTDYFCLEQRKTLFHELDKWLRRRVRACYWNWWRLPKTKIWKLLQQAMGNGRDL